ncbi:MAG TPA: GxxExxY protein [Tichowtungia sp.]|nr:GxxExxY protein [Tichowtungia sp.]
MSIYVEHPVRTVSEQTFREIDYRVMKLAFDAHNRMGRFYDEKIYQNELMAACIEMGINATSEVKIELTHKTFAKELFIDLLIEHRIIYELKAARSIISDHRIQTIDYLLLSNIQYGKIVNFRSASVQHEFVSTTLKHADRKKISICDEGWGETSETAVRLMTVTTDLLSDWGAFLDTNLYKEAIAYFFGGLEEISKPVEIYRNGAPIGTQRLPLLSPTKTFFISSIKTGIESYQSHLQRLLNCTHLTSLFWINLNRSEVQFRTLHA